MTKDVRIVFVSLNKNNSSGSYRIWVKDYNNYFNSLGIDSKIIEISNLTKELILETDVIIFGKSMRNYLSNVLYSVKKIKPSLIVGTITPPRDMILPFDFVMAGSLEEYDSLSFHKNVILNAHIESLYHDTDIKIHKKEEKLKICYHGWTPHLYAFQCGLQDAIERYDNLNQKVELHIVTEHTEDTIDWDTTQGKPNVDIVYKKWNINTVKKDIQNCDIGICPGVYDLTPNKKSVDNQKGKFNTDYVMRYKNKTNNGRAIVFMQLGLPVIADFSPSNFHLFGDQKCGLVAHTSDGWYKSLVHYSSFKNRNLIAKNAKELIDRDYNPLVWAKRYYENIINIKESLNNEQKN